ncbi:unnamed protein product [Leuciscus chuanchicus]
MLNTVSITVLVECVPYTRADWMGLVEIDPLPISVALSTSSNTSDLCPPSSR